MKELSGKKLSLLSKIFAAAFVVIGFVLNGVFKWGVEAWSLIQIGMFLALVFAPVDVSKIAEKFGRKQV